MASRPAPPPPYFSPVLLDVAEIFASDAVQPAKEESKAAAATAEELASGLRRGRRVTRAPERM
jgi:hypothetical protein